jgi:hypothetical protein
VILSLGLLLGMLFGKNLVLLLSVPPAVALVAVLFTLSMRESPKYLLLKRGDRAGALSALKFYQSMQTNY